MRNLIVHEFISLDGVVQAPGGKDEDRDGGFAHGGWTIPYWHDDIGVAFFQAMQNVDAFLLGRRTYVTHAEAFEPMKPGDPFGDLMNAPKKYVLSRTLKTPIWRNTTIIRDNPVEAVRSLKAQPGKDIMMDGSTRLVPVLLEHDLIDQLYLTLYPLTLGGGKRILPEGLNRKFRLLSAKP
ncbi:MAG TPA: dihydrofolate reductase family protein, partial [Gemmatimonadales bacterium]|nr:dihydrofolate reductase family protein [Gemmatimonadales bacterium]